MRRESINNQSSIIFFYMGVIVVGFFLLGYSHELVHQAIYRHYGIESEIHLVKYFPDFATVAEEGCPNETCELAHMQNEIFGYHMTAFYIVISTGILFIMIMKQNGGVE
jgi:hypothetical protein